MTTEYLYWGKKLSLQIDYFNKEKFAKLVFSLKNLNKEEKTNILNGIGIC